MFTARTREALTEQLEDFAEMPVEEQKVFDADDYVKVVFVCPGQGAQWLGMARQLYAAEPVFQSAIDACRDAFKSYATWDLLEELNASDNHRFEEIDVIQPMLVAIEIALGKLWQSKGIQPDIVVGHSMGEVAAAYLAEMISLEEAAQIICTRSQLMKQTSGKGAMAVTDLTLEEAKQRLAGKEELLSVAVQNSPTSTVIAGDPAALDTLLSALESEGRFCRKIKVDVASHSPQMEPLMSPLRNALARLQPADSSITFFSTAQNRVLSGSQLNADYWVSNLRNPVQFGEVVSSILKQDKAVFIELSPHPVLLNAVQDNIAATGKTGKGIASLLREKDELVTFYKAFGQFYSCGLPVDWKHIYPQVNQFVMLPNYQWQKERFWFDQKPEIGMVSSQAKPATDLLYQPVWEGTTLTVGNLPASVWVIKDKNGLAEKVSAHLQSKGIAVTLLAPGEVSDNIPEAILHIGAMDVQSAYQYQPATSLLSVQQLMQHFNGKGKIPKLCIATCQAQVTEKADTSLDVQNAQIWGLARTIRNEHPEWSPVIADFPADVSPETLCSILSSNGAVKEFAFRRGEWLTPVLNKVQDVPAASKQFSSNGTYLITGGTSGLGLIFAEWLTNKGVKHLALVSRSGMKAETGAVLERLRAKGVQAEVFSADITQTAALAKLVMEIETALPTIRGVVHAAGILDDGAVLNLSPVQFSKVISPKVDGAWNLHQYFHNRTLDDFILFSSGASVLGTAAQGNYTAANMALDQLAQYRHAKGLAAMSINFGNIGETGLAAADLKRGERLKEQGMGVLLPADLPAYFDALLSLPGAQYMLMDIDFSKWSTSNSGVKGNPFFSKVLPQDSSAALEETGKEKSFANMAAAVRHFRNAVKQHISAITKVPAAKIKEDATFKSMGIDSLMAVQLKNKLQADFELTLAVSSIWTYPTVEKYADFLIAELKIADQFAAPVSQPKPAEKSVDEMSLEELMRELEEKSK